MSFIEKIFGKSEAQKMKEFNETYGTCEKCGHDITIVNGKTMHQHDVSYIWYFKYSILSS